MEMSKIFGEFGPVKDIHLSHLGIAIMNAAGTYVSYDKDKDEIVDVDLIDFDANNMVYAIPVAIKDVKKGSIIKHVSGNPVFVTSVENGIHVIDVVNSEKKEIVPPKSLFGFDYVTQIVSLIDFSSTGASSENPFGNLFPLLMLGNNNEHSSIKDKLAMMMMMNNFGSKEKNEDNNSNSNFFDMSNPWMLSLLFNNNDNKDGGSESKDFFLMMMLMNQKKG